MIERKMYIVRNGAVFFTPAEDKRVSKKAAKLGLTVVALIELEIERECDKRPRSLIDDQLDMIARQIATLKTRADKLRAKREADFDTATFSAVIKRLAAPAKKRSAA